MKILLLAVILQGVLALDMECSFTSKEIDRNNTQCDVNRSFVIRTPEEVLVSTVNGKTENFPELALLSIRRQIVHYFPRGLEKFFPKLENLSIKKSELKAVTQADLKPLTELKRLHLRFNEIENLDGDLFKFNVKLEVIDFTGNRIKTVGVDILQPLTRLQKALFKGNVCIDNTGFASSGLEELKAQLEIQCFVEDYNERT